MSVLEQIEATVDPLGRVHLSEAVRFERSHRAVVTIYDEVPADNDRRPIVGSMELVDEDLETASREIADEFGRAIERSRNGLLRPAK